MSRTVRILVTGSREWRDNKIVFGALADAWIELGAGRPLIVVHGGARGADAIAHAWARGAGRYGLPADAEVWHAQWDRHGKSAGHRRNAEMVSVGADICLAFPLGESRGTRGCVALAEKAGIPVRVFEGGLT